MNIAISIKLLRPESVVPSRQTEGSAGMDLHACLDTPIELSAGERVTVPTGIALELPRGVEAQIRARSGLAAKHGIGLANGIGTIDSDFRGEIHVILINWSKEMFVIQPGMRIAQMVIARYDMPEWEIVEQLGETERGENMLGSTGMGGQAG